MGRGSELYSKSMRSETTRRVVLLCALLSSSLWMACATRRPGDPIRPGFNLYTPDQDIQLGREAAAQVRKEVDIVNDPPLQNYLAQLGERLASHPAAGSYPYSFTLINDKEINAFALPGGPVFLNSGIIAAADTEGQLAGVLAHEISHIALRHATNQASKANLIEIPAVLGGAAIGEGSVAAQLAQLGLGLGVNSLMLRYSRDAESQADALGTHIMAEAGYNPEEMARFFETLEARGGNRAPQFLSSHPNPGNRMEAVRVEIRTLPQHQYGADTGQFSRMKQQVAELPNPTNRPQRMALRAPQTSSGQDFRRLDTTAFSMAYPASWNVYGDRGSAVITLAPPEGLVRTNNGRTSLGYGSVLSFHRPEAGRLDLQNSTEELIHQLIAVNPNLRAAASGRRQAIVDGQDGLLTRLTGPSPYGGAEANFLLTVARPQGLFYIVFVAPQDRVGNVEAAFDQMLQSIRFRG